MGFRINVGPVSAYGIALEQGFVGTKAEWLQSLKGGALPDVTDDDNGKFAVVIDGNWTAVEIDDGDEEAF